MTSLSTIEKHFSQFPSLHDNGQTSLLPSS